MAVVTGMDEKVYKFADVKNNPTDLIISLLIFTRAHDESLTKKNRVEAQVRSLTPPQLRGGDVSLLI
ncbi:hypothetical protein TUM17569_23060 [Klebsiella oxytoca]|jgi:hypothetical protein|nr:hypothetical protein TUM17568_25600 [Klebsiella oxytoca]GJK96845.1 hypothetical protein TUM17569_23060 [Klebsiella oxytoca]